MFLEWRRLEKFIFEILNIKWIYRFEKREIEIDYIYICLLFWGNDYVKIGFIFV